MAFGTSTSTSNLNKLIFSRLMRFVLTSSQINFKLLIKTISGNLLNRMFGESNSWTNIRLRQFYVKMAKIVKKSMSAEIGHLFTISHSRSSWTTE